MEARTAFRSEAFRDVLDLIQDIFSTSSHHVLKHGGNWLKIPTDRIDWLLRAIEQVPMVEICGHLRLSKDHLEGLFVVLAAEGTVFRDIADLQHEVYQVPEGKDLVVESRVLRVYGLDEAPVFVDDLGVVRVGPEITCVHEIQEERLIQGLAISQFKSEIGQELYRLAVDWQQ